MRLQVNVRVGRPGTSAVLAVALTLCAVADAGAQCAAPQFRVVQDLINYEVGRGAAHLSLPPADFTLDKLLCLTQTLKRRNPDWKSVRVLMFDSETAAANFVGGKMGVPEEFWRFDRELRAFYTLDVTEHEEYLVMTPLGFGESEAFDTRIALPAMTPAHCRLELSGRCVLAFRPLDYPTDVRDSPQSRTFTVAGTITADGTVAKLTVADTGSESVDGHDSFVRAAIANLNAWLIEPAKREDAIRLTYSYVVDSSLPRGKIDVQFALPNQVTIRANPAR